MRGTHQKGIRGKSNLIKRNVEKVWGARYLPKNTVYNVKTGFIRSDIKPLHCWLIRRVAIGRRVKSLI
jgi:hypothetical protein